MCEAPSWRLEPQPEPQPLPPTPHKHLYLRCEHRTKCARWYFIPIFKHTQKCYVWLSLYVSLTISFSSTIVPPLRIGRRQEKKKKKKTKTNSRTLKLKGIPIKLHDCCFIIYSPIATLPYFIFNHILSWLFLQTCKDHFNLHMYLLVWVASKG